MTDPAQAFSQLSQISNTQNLNLADITGLYVEVANKVAEHTRVSTEELTRIIASMHMANQTY